MKKQIFFVLVAGLLSISVSSFAQQKPDNSDQAKKERVEKKARVHEIKERVGKVKPDVKNQKERFEKFKASREEFIAQKMQLTDSEKQPFFALDKEFQTKKFELHKALREVGQKVRKARQDKQTVAEADYKNLLDLIAQTKLKEAQLEQEYKDKFLKVVSAEKVYLYQRAEQEFGEKFTHERKSNNQQKK